MNRSNVIAFSLVLLLGCITVTHAQHSLRGYHFSDSLDHRGLITKKAIGGGRFIADGVSVFKLNAQDSLQWQTSISLQYGIGALCPMPDGGVIITRQGLSGDVIRDYDMELPVVRLSAEGKLLKAITLRFPDSSYYYFDETYLTSLPNGRFAINGNAFSNYLAILDSGLNIIRQVVFINNDDETISASPLLLHETTDDTLRMAFDGAYYGDHGPTSVQIIGVLSFSLTDSVVPYRSFRSGEAPFIPTSMLYSSTGGWYVSGAKNLLFVDAAQPGIFAFDNTGNARWKYTVPNSQSTAIYHLAEGPDHSLFAVIDNGTTAIIHLDSSGIIASAATITVGLGPLTNQSIDTLRIVGRYKGEMIWGTIPANLQSCVLNPTLASQQWEIPQEIPYIGKLHLEPFVMHTEPAAVDWKSIPVSSTYDFCASLEVIPSANVPSLVTIRSNPIAASQPLQLSVKDILPGRYSIALRDISGKVHYSSTYELEQGRDIHLWVSGLASGLYFVELADANSLALLWRSKVVIE